MDLKQVKSTGLPLKANSTPVSVATAQAKLVQLYNQLANAALTDYNTLGDFQTQEATMYSLFYRITALEKFIGTQPLSAKKKK